VSEKSRDRKSSRERRREREKEKHKEKIKESSSSHKEKEKDNGMFQLPSERSVGKSRHASIIGGDAESCWSSVEEEPKADELERKRAQEVAKQRLQERRVQEERVSKQTVEESKGKPKEEEVERVSTSFSSSSESDEEGIITSVKNKTFLEVSSSQLKRCQIAMESSNQKEEALDTAASNPDRRKSPISVPSVSPQRSGSILSFPSSGPVSAPPQPQPDLDPAVSELNFFTEEEVQQMERMKARLDTVLDNEDNISVRWVGEGKAKWRMRENGKGTGFLKL
jgi:hypothetical protein